MRNLSLFNLKKSYSKGSISSNLLSILSVAAITSLGGMSDCLPSEDDDDTPSTCDEPQAGDYQLDFDLDAWLLEHEMPTITTTQSGEIDGAPFQLTNEEFANFRTAWDQFIGPIPESCVDLDPQIEPLDLTAEELEMVETEYYQMKKVTYRGAHGDRIPAYLLVPNNLQKAVPAVFVMHQSNAICGKKEPAGVCGAYNLDFAKDLAKRGYVTLAADSFGYGERDVYFSNYGYEYPDAAEALSMFPDSTLVGMRISDVMRGIDYLQTLPEVDASKIGMIGHSNGGIETLHTSAYDERIKCAISNAGPNLMRREVQSFDGVTPGIARWAVFGYIPAMGYYDGDIANLPIETHQLYGLIAPRGLFVSLMEDDTVAAVYDRVEFSMQEAKKAHDWLGGNFAYHTIFSGRTPECIDEWGAPYNADYLYTSCVNSSDASCKSNFDSIGMTKECVENNNGYAFYCAHELYWDNCRIKEGKSQAECTAIFASVGVTAETANTWGDNVCRRNHGWYPETENEAYPWLDACFANAK